MFKSHLEMIGRNETPSKKAKFWQSYVRSLKGSEDIRAHEAPKSRSYRPWSAYADLPSHYKSIFDEPATPAERISSHGYRYLPVHRETYGYSPRPIYDHHYSRSIPYNEYLNLMELPWDCNELKRLRKLRGDALKKYKITNNPVDYNLYLDLSKEIKRTSKNSYVNYIREAKKLSPEGSEPDTYWNFIQLNRFPTASADIERAWNEHLKRMADIERRYPSRYGLYLKDKPNALVPLEYEPEDKPLFSERARAPSVPSRFTRSPSPFERATSVPLFDRAGSLEPSPLRRLRASSFEPLDRAIASKFDVPLNLEPRSMSPTPIKPGRWAPRQTEVAYNNDGLPIYHPALRRGAFSRLLNPSPYLPISAITRDPWWWDLEDLHPFRAHLPYTHLPPLLRTSYLSPVKRRYLWTAHPVRPFAHIR